jgi:hypothetical protein
MSYNIFFKISNENSLIMQAAANKYWKAELAEARRHQQ